jgi:plastocyanin
MRTLPLLIATLLTAALAELPLIASAQQAPVPQAMVEGNASDINTWGFSAVVPIGGSITWTNMGAQSHTVSSTDGTFDTGLVPPGGMAALTFDTVGVYAYVCTPHPWMKGFVAVTVDATTASQMAMVEGNASDINTWGFAVSVPAGQSVAWTNLGAQAHTVAAVDGSFDTGLVSPGSSAPLQFDVPGVYAYLCTPHPWMKGNVAVN